MIVRDRLALASYTIKADTTKPGVERSNLGYLASQVQAIAHICKPFELLNRAAASIADHLSLTRRKSLSVPPLNRHKAGET
jgi:hypothetical protein